MSRCGRVGGYGTGRVSGWLRVVSASFVHARGLRREDFFDELGADEGGELLDDILSRGWIGGG